MIGCSGPVTSHTAMLLAGRPTSRQKQAWLVGGGLFWWNIVCNFVFKVSRISIKVK